MLAEYDSTELVEVRESMGKMAARCPCYKNGVTRLSSILLMRAPPETPRPA
jgi:hypothetical protein